MAARLGYLAPHETLDLEHVVEVDGVVHGERKLFVLNARWRPPQHR